MELDFLSQNAIIYVLMAWVVIFVTAKALKLEKYGFTIKPYSLTYKNYKVQSALTKMLGREDAHVEVFDQYLSICRSLNNSDRKEIEANIRLFEVILIREAGYGLDFKSEAHSKEIIKEDSTYKFDPMSGFLPLKDQLENRQDDHFKGKDIINVEINKLEFIVVLSGIQSDTYSMIKKVHETKTRNPKIFDLLVKSSSGIM